MIADMDASSTIGAAETGVIFNYGLIWFMILLIIPLFLIQEVAGRIGTVTEKGLGEVIRVHYGRKTALFLTMPMVITNMATYTIEYIGIAVSLQLLGVSILFSLPVFYILNLLVVIRRKYGNIEIILLAISLIFIASFILALFARGIKDYNPLFISSSPHFLFILAVNVGAVIMPFMLFFQASATAEKMAIARTKHSFPGVSENPLNVSNSNFTGKAIKSMRIETLLGATVTELLMVIVDMTMSGINPRSSFASPHQLSAALIVIAGNFAPYLFGLGLLSAAFLALIVISIGSAWGFAEAVGVGRGKAKLIYIIESFPALIIAILIPETLLINAILDMLVAFVFVLIGPAVIMELIARDHRIMGDFASTRIWELAYCTSVIFVFLFGILALV
ncbi:MAG: NRAMP family divalent metal transporter [Thermoplasmataceae archaeon]